MRSSGVPFPCRRCCCVVVVLLLLLLLLLLVPLVPLVAVGRIVVLVVAQAHGVCYIFLRCRGS